MYPHLKERVLATDLDHTLVHSEESTQPLLQLLKDVSLIYITGRHLKSAQHLIRQQQLPIPDVLVCDVGATIYTGPAYTYDLNWQIEHSLLLKEPIQQCAQQIGLTKQEIPCKVRLSYFGSPLQYDQFKKLLNQRKIDVQLIYSDQQYIDVLPANVSKATALQYVLTMCNIPDHIVVAGDSENDVSLFTLGYPAIGVQNCCSAIKNLEHLEHVHLAHSKGPKGILEVWCKLFC